MKFKVGDKVKKIKSSPGCDFNDGREVTINEIRADNIIILQDGNDIHKYCPCEEEDLELISSGETISQKKTIMNTLTAKVKRIFSPSLQKQYKAGLIDNCGELTPTGREEIDMLLRNLVEEDFTKRAEEIIKEEKEK